jgi:hypothetical protein
MESGRLGKPKKYQITKSMTPTNSGRDGERWSNPPPNMPPSEDPMNPKNV